MSLGVAFTAGKLSNVQFVG